MSTRKYYYLAEKPRHVELRRSDLLFNPRTGGKILLKTADRWTGTWVSLNTFLNEEDRRVSRLELGLLMPEVST